MTPADRAKPRRRFVMNGDYRAMVVKRGKVFGHIVTFTTSCSGCYESVDGYNVNNFPFDSKSHCYIGAGCEECGYTGKRRRSYWLPLNIDVQRQLLLEIANAD